VTPGYFETLGMPMRTGRTFNDSDDERAPGVAIVNESLAAALWPGQNPIGRRMRTGMTPRGVWLEVVGIVGDVPMTGLRDELGPVVYIPWAQAGVTMESNTIMLRSARATGSLAAAARTEIGQTDSRIAVARIQTMDAVVQQSIAQPRQLMMFLNLFGLLALILGAVGVYGVLANFVRARMFEFGVRLALGSSPRSVVRLVLTRAATLISLGVALGIALSLAGSRVYAAFLYGIAPNDPLTLLGAAAALAVTGGLAAFLPCRRAALADPIAVLRGEG
jgi:putative ABC transport system permease protein